MNTSLQMFLSEDMFGPKCFHLIHSSSSPLFESSELTCFLTCSDRDECNVGNGSCEQIYRNTIGSYSCECESGFVLAEDMHNCKEGGCKHELQAPRGQVTSPNYPDEYPNKKDCIWHFVTTPGHRLQLVSSLGSTGCGLLWPNFSGGIWTLGSPNAWGPLDRHLLKSLDNNPS